VSAILYCSVDLDELPAIRSSSGRTSSLENLAEPGVRRLLNHVKQLVAFDGHIEVWVDGLSLTMPSAIRAYSCATLKGSLAGTAGGTSR
jgi:hypothetical protein